MERVLGEVLGPWFPDVEIDALGPFEAALD
jgi:hypothetical protein